jgi:hypothetical protein
LIRGGLGAGEEIPEGGFELLPGAVEELLDGADGAVEGLGGLLVAQTLEADHFERKSLIDGELSDGVIERLGEFGAAGGLAGIVAGRGEAVGGDVGAEELGSAGLVAVVVEAEARGDAEEPGGEGAAGFVFPAGLPESPEGLLGQFLGDVGVADALLDEVEDAPLPAQHKLIECLGLVARDQGHQAIVFVGGGAVFVHGRGEAVRRRPHPSIRQNWPQLTEGTAVCGSLTGLPGQQYSVGEEPDMEEISCDEAKFGEMIVYISLKSETDPYFGLAKLERLLFNADFSAHLRHGKPISGAAYVRHEAGPAPGPLKAALASLEASGALKVRIVPYYHYGEPKPIALREPNLERFSGAEVALIDGVIDAGGDLTAAQMREKSREFIGWKLAGPGERIPYETSLLGSGESLGPEVRDLAASLGARAAELVGAA